MPRPATGTIVERRNAAGGINRMLRFNVGGRKRTVALGDVTRAEAEERLRHELADVERGVWKPPAAERLTQTDAPTFHAYSEQWWTLNEGQLSENTRADYRWRLEKHLLGYFGELPLDAIKAATIEAYIAGKLAGVVYEHGCEVRREKPLSARSINMTVILLGAILERAVKHELIARNAAKGCRARERTPARSYLETAAQIEALIGAAAELDHDAPKDKRHIKRRAMIATLTFAGLRIGELCSLRWRDVDLAAGWLTVGESKTDAGCRRVKIRGALRDELSGLRAAMQTAEGYVYPTRTGARLSPENFRNRVLAASVKRANEKLAKENEPPLPDGLTPHSLRRTFCSLLYALGESPPVVMDEMGHTDPALALRVYAQAMRRGEDERATLRALVEGEFRHSIDTTGVSSERETAKT
jgi:integrase